MPRPVLLRLLALLLALHLPLSGMAAPLLLAWAGAAMQSGHGLHDHASHDHASHDHAGHAPSHDVAGPAAHHHHHHDPAGPDTAAVSPDSDDPGHHHDHCAFCHIAGSVIAPALAAAPAQRGAHVLVASRPQLHLADAPEAPFRPPSAPAR